MIYDVNSGAVTGVVNVDLSYAASEADTYSYVPVEFNGTYDREQAMYDQQMAKGLRGPRRDGRRYDPNLMVASLNPGSAFSGMKFATEPSVLTKDNFKLDFKVKGSVARDKSPGRSSMAFGAQDNGNGSFKAKNSKFEAPGLGYGGADFKVKNWGNSPKDSIKSTMKNHELQLDVESVQMDAATGTMSVKQRASLKRQN
jgi:hypothetical protein